MSVRRYRGAGAIQGGSSDAVAANVGVNLEARGMISSHELPLRTNWITNMGHSESRTSVIRLRPAQKETIAMILQRWLFRATDNYTSVGLE